MAFDAGNREAMKYNRRLEVWMMRFGMMRALLAAILALLMLACCALGESAEPEYDVDMADEAAQSIDGFALGDEPTEVDSYDYPVGETPSSSSEPEATVNLARARAASGSASSLTIGVGEWAMLDGAGQPGDAEAMYVLDGVIGNPGCIQLTAAGSVRGLRPGQATVYALNGDGEPTGESWVIEVLAAPAEVSVTTGAWFIGVGEAYDGLEATAIPPEGEWDCAGEIVWTSSNPDVATVDGTTGVVTGVSEGQADITARSYNGRFMTCRLTVCPAPESVTLNEVSIELSLGDSFDRLYAGVPQGSASGRITYESSAPEIASVSDDGLVTATGVGTAVVTARAFNGASAECQVRVAARAETVAFDLPSLRLGVGQSVLNVARAFRADGTQAGGRISYYIDPMSENPSCVALNTSTGMVQGKRPGTARIIAYMSGSSASKASCEIEVVAAPQGVHIASKRWELGVGETYEGLSAVLEPPEGEEVCEGQVAWSSSDPRVLAIDPDTGFMTGVAMGQARVTAQAQNGVSAICTITVKVAPQSAALDQSAIVLSAGMTERLQLKLEEGAASAKVEFTSTDDRVATVSEKGVVTAIAAGEATVSVELFNGVRVECRVEVLAAPDAVTLGETSMTLGVAERAIITAQATANGSVTKTNLEFYVDESSPNPDCIELNPMSGVVRAVQKGEALIGVRTHNGVVPAQLCAVRVCAAPERIELDADYWSIGVGEIHDGIGARLVAAGEDEVAGSVAWSSQDTGIAAIDAVTGVVTGMQPGTTTITVKAYNGVTASHSITVGATPASITLDQSEMTLHAYGRTAMLSAMLSGGAVSGRMTYSSSNSAVAAVDDSGVIVTGQTGDATITATTFNGLSATCAVHVIEPAATIELPEHVDVAYSSYAALEVRVLDQFGEAYQGDVNLSFAPEGFVNYDGARLQGLKQGETALTVTADELTRTCSISVLSYRALNPVLSIAHRGGCAYWPENTLQAFQNAASTGCEGVELDVQTTKDGVQIVNHNTTVVVGRTTYVIANYTWAQLKAAAPSLCTLEEAIEVIDAAGLDLHLELKETAVGAECVRIVREHNMEDRTVYFGFFQPQLRQVYESDPTAILGLSLSTAPSSADLANLKRDLHLSFLVINQNATTQALTDYWHTQDLKVCVWTVNDRNAVKRFCDMGVDYVLSNYPDYCVQVR